MSGKRKRLSLTDKIKVIAESERSSLGARKLAQQFGVGKTQINDILKNKSELKRLYEDGVVSVERKRKFPKTEGLIVDQAVFGWFCEARNKGVPISGPLIQEKAREAAKNLRIDLKASNGWLNKFCQRHNIIFKAFCRESNSGVENVEDWTTKLPLILQEYSTRDIFHVDETGLYYRATPTKTFTLGDDEVSSRKYAHQRFTILLCANMEGEKEDPLIIAKSKTNPETFEGTHIDKLPLEMVSNKRAWMTTDIMTTWLHKFNNKMKKQNRKIVLFLDTASSHPKTSLENIRLMFIPPNAPQPLNQGVIQNFKIAYRSFLIKRHFSFIDKDNKPLSFRELEKNITTMNALIWISAAWKKLSPVTIRNCFVKAGFTTLGYKLEDDEDEEYQFDQLLFTVNGTVINMRQFSSMDNEILTESVGFNMTDYIEEIRDSSYEKSDSEDEECEDTKSSISSLAEACARLRDLEKFFFNHNNDVAVDISEVLVKCEDENFKIKLKNM